MDEILNNSHLVVLEAVRRHAPLTRAGAAQLTGLSRSAVHTLTTDLERAGLIREVERRTGGERGRPAVAFAYNGEAGQVLAISFGHDRFALAVADLAGRILDEAATEIDVGSDPDRALEAVAAHARALLAGVAADGAPLRAALVSLPGPIDDAHGTIGSFSILPGWAAADPVGRLHELLGVPVTIENDANVAAYAEAQMGVGAGYRHLIYVKASTGVGAGLILDGHIYRGAAGMAGELGHVTVEPSGKICRCGSKGCLETVAGAGAITSALAGMHIEMLTLREVIALARAGDAAAERALADAGAALGRAIGEISNVLNPQLIVLGGELGEAGEIVLEPLRASLGRVAMRVITRDLEVKADALGSRAELIGAVSLCAARVHGDESIAIRPPDTVAAINGTPGR